MSGPDFPVGTKVLSHLFYDPDKPKTVHSATWDGAEYAYVLIDDEGVYDEGYFVHHLKGANQ